jgi:hypothetical protein
MLRKKRHGSVAYSRTLTSPGVGREMPVLYSMIMRRRRKRA